MENTKRILSTLLFSILISVGFTNCKDSKNQQSGDDPKPETVKRPDEVIDIDVAKVQYETYKKRRVDLIQQYENSIDGYDDKGKILQKQTSQETQVDPNDPNGEQFDVARYVYWNYDTIKNYLKYIEQEAEAADVEISTLRFYFSNYGPDDKSAVHPRQNSIMISPTLHQNDREYIFSIDDSDAQNKKPILLSDSFEVLEVKEKGMGDSNGQDQRSYASFISKTFGPNTSYIAPPGGSSVTMNKGNAAPPPHNEN